MAKKTYIVSYSIYNNRNELIKSGQAKLKNKYSELDAKISTDTNLRKLYPTLSRLIVHSCIEENPFKDIFGGIFKF